MGYDRRLALFIVAPPLADDAGAIDRFVAARGIDGEPARAALAAFVGAVREALHAADIAEELQVFFEDEDRPHEPLIESWDVRPFAEDGETAAVTAAKRADLGRRLDAAADYLARFAASLAPDALLDLLVLLHALAAPGLFVGGLARVAMARLHALPPSERRAAIDMGGDTHTALTATIADARSDWAVARASGPLYAEPVDDSAFDWPTEAPAAPAPPPPAAMVE